MAEAKEIQLKIADIPFSARILHEENRALCADYLTAEPPMFSIPITPDRIEKEREAIRKLEIKARHEFLPCSDAEAEFNALYRETAERLSAYQTILLHGSAVAVNGKAFIFVAPSGTGKSTHTRLWREVFGNRAVMVNDDKPLVKMTEKGAYVFGSPWNGKHHLSANISCPIQAVCFLNRGTENAIEPTGGKQAYITLVKSIYHSENTAREKDILKTLEGLFKQTAFYQLYCNMDREAALVAYEGMTREHGKRKLKPALSKKITN